MTIPSSLLSRRSISALVAVAVAWDIIVDPHTGLAYLACGSLNPRQHWLHPGDDYDMSFESESDHLYVMDENDSYSEVKAMETSTTTNGDGLLLQPFSQDLRFHGFDIYWDPEDPQNMTFMFVNHQLAHGAVSIFSHIRGSDHMIHVETVHSGLLHSPNNVIAMSKRAFYATNDMMFPKGIMNSVSKNLRLPDGHVVYHSDDGEFSVAIPRIRYPNGIAQHNGWIYVASCTDPGVQIYKESAKGKLQFHGRIIYNDGIPDNISVDPETDHIYSTIFLKVQETHKFFRHPSLNTTTVAGTKIVRLTQRPDPSTGFDVETLLLDSGELMPSATVAAIQRRNQIRRMLVGCVMCDFLVGTPRFTKVKPKHQKKDRFDKYLEANEAEAPKPNPLKFSSRSMRTIVRQAALYAVYLGIVGVAVYYGNTYFFVVQKYWPVPDDVKGIVARNMVYMATYFDLITQSPESAVGFYKAALRRIEGQSDISKDTLAVLQINVRMADCLYRTGKIDEAEVLLNETVPSLQRLSSESLGNNHTVRPVSESKDKKENMWDKMYSTVDDCIYQASYVLAQIYKGKGNVEEGKRVFKDGIQALKQMKKDISEKFDGSNLVSYSIYEDVRAKEALISTVFAETLYMAKNTEAAKLFFQAILASVKQHKAQVQLTPRVIMVKRTYVNEWECLDTYVLIYLARMHIDDGELVAAAALLDYARDTVEYELTAEPIRCINCEAGILSQRGRIAEASGDNKTALRRYREAYEYARINFSDYQHELVKDFKRLQNTLSAS
ncbi:hypothetical protein GGH99_003928 [Coemansia sp. RSA 1285]|nr:hypothetical protein GGH99_003928 [Coemansia sp. RSA 1285]